MSYDGIEEGMWRHEKREIASLTKIMVIYVVLTLSWWWMLNLEETYIEIPAICEQIIGTTAGLWFGDMLSIKDLLYGMMLPSGNDAAFLLARYFGI